MVANSRDATAARYRFATEVEHADFLSGGSRPRRVGLQPLLDARPMTFVNRQNGTRRIVLRQEPGRPQCARVRRAAGRVAEPHVLEHGPKLFERDGARSNDDRSVTR